VYREGAGEPLPVAPEVAPQLDLVPSTEVRYRRTDHAFSMWSGQHETSTARGRVGEVLLKLRVPFVAYDDDQRQLCRKRNGDSAAEGTCVVGARTTPYNVVGTRRNQPLQGLDGREWGARFRCPCGVDTWVFPSQNGAWEYVTLQPNTSLVHRSGCSSRRQTFSPRITFRRTWTEPWIRSAFGQTPKWAAAAASLFNNIYALPSRPRYRKRGRSPTPLPHRLLAKLDRGGHCTSTVVASEGH